MVATWSAAAAAGAFVVLTAGILIAIRFMLTRLARLQASAEAVQRDMHRLSAELSGVLQPAEETIRTVHRQLQSLDGLFTAARQVGGTLEQTTAAMERVTAVLSLSAARHAERISEERQANEAMQWAELGMTAWQLWQNSRKQAASRKTDNSSFHSESRGCDEGHSKNEGSDNDVNT